MSVLGVTRKDFVRYSVLPGLRPRLHDMFIKGFQHIPFFMALVYQAVRLLPANHPYCRSGNIGKFGVRQVIAAAANNLVLSWRNLDQILLFISILIGVVIVLIQLVLFCFSFMAMPAAAMPTSFAGFFLIDPAYAPQDLSFMMLDLVFGVPDMFGSCVDPAVGVVCEDANGTGIVDTDGNWILGGPMNNLQWPHPVHQGLHQMFQVYSFGLLVVATLIMAYFIATILLETAESGTAFGKRYNKVWAPLRFVVAFGLLIPVGYGLNSSQFIVLYAAKYGSGFATNGWNLFNDSLVGTYVGEVQDLVSVNNSPEVNGLLQFFYVANTCYWLEWLKSGSDVRMYAVRDNSSINHVLLIEQNGAYANPPIATGMTYTTPYDDLIDFLEGDRQAVIRLGIYDPDLYKGEKGHVEPTCGEIILPLMDARDPTPGTPGPAPVPPNPPERSAVVMQAFYFAVMRNLWYKTFYPPDGADPVSPNCSVGETYAYNTALRYVHWDHSSTAPLPDPDFKAGCVADYSKNVQGALLDPTDSTGTTGGYNVASLDTQIGNLGALQEAIDSGRWTVNTELLEKGWAGAGIWYNKIAELNGSVSASVLNIPIPSKWPKVMEQVQEKKKQQDQNVPLAQRFNPQLAGDHDVPVLRPEDQQMAVALWKAFSFWQADGHATSTHTAVTGNPFIDFINNMLGTSGLYSMRKNPTVHPLAQLVGVGRSLMEAATRNVFSPALAAIFGAGSDKLGAGLSQVGISVCMTIATIALTAGFILFYIVPFLPFIYFFFAVGGWVKAIFEAMVGAPLWALAHIRIDGNGLPGQAAVNGYFLIFEIFLRPILIIFSLLASISIFAAMVNVLNQTWDLVVSNLSGFDVETELNPPAGITSALDYFRGPIDEFFFTVVYVVVVYMMAMSSFKLIDVIPSNILRWMGQSLMTFNDAKENAAESLVSSGSLGAQQGIQGVGGAMQQGLQGVAGLGGR